MGNVIKEIIFFLQYEILPRLFNRHKDVKKLINYRTQNNIANQI